MPPTLPCFRSPRGHCAAAITISTSSFSSSGSDQSFSNTLILVSSATTSVVMVPDSSPSRGGVQRTAVPVSSATASSFFSWSGARHVATSRRTTAAPRRSPSPCSVLSVRAPGGGVVPASPSSGGGGDDEATSRRKRKLRYRKWGVEDELKVLTALAKLRRENLGVHPQASVLLHKIRVDGGLLRRGVDATALSDKVFKLKTKFVKAANKAAAGGLVRHLRNYRNMVLFRASMDVWPDMLPDGVAAAFLFQVPRRRGNHAGIRL